MATSGNKAPLDMYNQPIVNIGAPGTDFNATGGLTLADALAISAGGAAITGDITQRSGAAGTNARVFIGRTSNEVSLNVVGGAGQIVTDSAAGDSVLRWEAGTFFFSSAGTDVGNISSAGAWTLKGFTDITAGGLRVRGGETTPSGGAGTTNATILLSGPDSANALFLTGFRGTTRQFLVGTDTSAITLAGIAKQASVDLGFYLATPAAFVAFFDDSDSGRLVLGGGLRLGSAAGLLVAGSISGVVTVTSAAAAGTWTMTLPTAVGAAGQQLTDAAGDGITSWAAAGSLREFKHLLGVLDPKTALRRIVDVPVELWRYRRDARISTGDYEKVYAGVVEDRAPWAMHFGGTIFDPVSAVGHSFAAIQALHQRVFALEAHMAAMAGAA